MHPNWPLRWPSGWHDAALLDLLPGTAIGCLLLPPGDGWEAIRTRASAMGLQVCSAEHPPSGVAVVKGEWAGVRMTPGQGDASSGPTGAPWIDSNGWLIRLTHMQTNSAVWVTAEPPKKSDVFPVTRHLVAIADAAAYGGRWIIALDDDLAAGLAAGQAEKRNAWQQIARECAFFSAHDEWNRWTPAANLLVVSSFAGEDEFFSRELLNLLARTSVSYSLVDETRLAADSLRGFRGVLYCDARTPTAAVRGLLLDFAERGGLLITTPSFGKIAGAPSPAPPHPRYDIRALGKGAAAIARQAPTDPYEVAQDTQTLLSHRYDLLRFYNGFLLGGYLTHSRDGRRGLVHIVNYGGAPPEDPPSAHVAGDYRSASLWSYEKDGPQRLNLENRRSGAEVHLPAFPVYGGIELEIG